MPCADGRSERGAAILLAMITVLLAAMIAAAALGDLGRSIESAEGRQDQAQARLLARAAADWARNVLADDAMRTTVDHTGEPWAVRVPPTPVGEAEVSGEVRDWSGRFNLNNLAPAGKPDEDAARQFERLLVALGTSATQATVLTQGLIGHIVPESPDESSDGPDPGATEQRIAHDPLLDVRELLDVPGFDTEFVQRLAPFVAAAPAPSRINVNTAPAEVLFALTSGLDLNATRVLVAERERAWFKDLADFTARLPEGGQAAPGTRLDVRSRHFLVTGRARHGNAVVRMDALLDRQENWPEILWQRIL